MQNRKAYQVMVAPITINKIISTLVTHSDLLNYVANTNKSSGVTPQCPFAFSLESKKEMYDRGIHNVHVERN